MSSTTCSVAFNTSYKLNDYPRKPLVLVLTILRSIALPSVLARAYQCKMCSNPNLFRAPPTSLLLPWANDSPSKNTLSCPLGGNLDVADGIVIQLNGAVQEIMTQLDVHVPTSQDKLVTDIATRPASPQEESPLKRRIDEAKLLAGHGGAVPDFDYIR